MGGGIAVVCTCTSYSYLLSRVWRERGGEFVADRAVMSHDGSSWTEVSRSILL